MENSNSTSNVLSEEMQLWEKLDGPLPFRLTNAYLFVAVLQKNNESLCSLIAALLHIPREEILSVEVLNPIILGQEIDKKDCVLDLLVLLNDHVRINLEIQVKNEGNWDDRSVYYLAQNVCSLQSGDSYQDLQPTVQIGILDFTFPRENTEFYQEIMLMNRKTHRIFNDKIALNVLCLSQIENATQEDKDSGLYLWAKIFKATTWKELKALAQGNNMVQKTVVTMAELSEDEKIREQCRRREKYERDRISSFKAGVSEGEHIMLTLMQRLLESGRGEEIGRIVSDEAYRKQVLEELGINMGQ